MFGIKSFFLLILLLVVDAKSQPKCVPFRVHSQIKLSSPPNFAAPKTLPKNWENDLVQSISKISSEANFTPIYLNFIKDSQSQLSPQDRYEWLTCILYYMQSNEQSSANQGWTAIVDNHPSRVLYPKDIDLALEMSNRPSTYATVPVILKISKSRTRSAQFQQQLYNDFGILALDHTDQQSPLVLKEFLFLLRNGIGKSLVKSLPSLHYLYAFAGHDSHAEVAAYHHQMKAISIGGVKSYPMETLEPRKRFELLASLAHEIGHAFILDHMNTRELKDVANKFGNWQLNEEIIPESSFYSPLFFQKYKGETLHSDNFTSKYAEKNVHEWFAEAFAARVMLNLGHAGLLGSNWSSLLVRPADSENYWIDYNNLNHDFLNWLNQKIKSSQIIP